VCSALCNTLTADLHTSIVRTSTLWTGTACCCALNIHRVILCVCLVLHRMLLVIGNVECFVSMPMSLVLISYGRRGAMVGVIGIWFAC